MFARDLLKVTLLAVAATAAEKIEPTGEASSIKTAYGLDNDILMETYAFASDLKLYHITESSQDPDFVAKRPLILNNGIGLSIARNFDKNTGAVYSKTNAAASADFKAAVMAMVAGDTLGDITTLNAVKSDMPKLWAELTKEQDERVKADTSGNTKSLADTLDAKQKKYDEELMKDETIAPSTCAKKTLAQTIATQSGARSAVADGKGEATVAQPSKALPITLFEYGYDLWMEGITATESGNTAVADAIPRTIEQVVAQIGKTDGKPSRAISYLAIGAGADQVIDSLTAKAEAWDSIDKILLVAPCKSTKDLSAAQKEKITLFLSGAKDQCGKTDYDAEAVAADADCCESYVYGCAGGDPAWFRGRGMAQKEVAFQMIAILGAKTLAVGMAAATLAMSLF